MFGRLVVAHLLKLERAVTLTRPPAPAQVSQGTPTALVLPRGGRFQEPHLMLLASDQADIGSHPDALVFADAHAVARFDDYADRRRRELADVLVGRAGRPCSAPAERVIRVLDRYPGCAVAVGSCEWGSLVALRDGPLLEISGSPKSATDLWPVFYGSLVYSWTSATLPLAELTKAVVIVGRYAVRADDRTGVLEVAARVRLQVIDWPASAVGRAS